MNRQRTTIDMIAKHAGVSITTVSNVLNNKGRFSRDVEDRVRNAADELSFTPSALIRSLQKGRTNLIGVRTWPYWYTGAASINMELLSGIADGLTEAHLDMLFYMDVPERDYRKCARVFMDGRVDSLIIAANLFPAEVLQDLAVSHLPTVVLYAATVPDGLGAITVDNREGIFLAVEHLAALGHRRVSYVIARGSNDLDERASAFEEAVRISGVERGQMLRPEDYNFDPDLVVDFLLQATPAPTALIAGDDNHALALIGAFNRRGVKVPADLSVIGFDDAPPAAITANLTTIRQPARQIGRLAVEFAIKISSGIPASYCVRKMGTTLVVRGTTGPPPKSGR